MTVLAPDYYVPKLRNRSKRLDTYFRDNKGIDPALLALELKWHIRSVLRYQRKLGIRKCRPNNPKKGEDDETTLSNV